MFQFRLEVSMAMKIEVAVFWVLTPCIDVRDLAASIFRVK
jgi:hypothetical protein